MKSKVDLYKIIKITAGHFHCWCDSNVGRIRKPNNAVPDRLWDEFGNQTISIKKEMISDTGTRPFLIPWWQRIWNWIKRILNL